MSRKESTGALDDSSTSGGVGGIWEKLNQSDCDALVELISNSKRSIQDVFMDFYNHCQPEYSYEMVIGKGALRAFLMLLFGSPVSEELCLSICKMFYKKPTDQKLFHVSVSEIEAYLQNQERDTDLNKRGLSNGLNESPEVGGSNLTSSAGDVTHSSGSLTRGSSEKLIKDKNLIFVRHLVCFLIVLEEGGKSMKSKAEFIFQLFDDDKNGYLDRKEWKCILNLLTAASELLGWSTTECSVFQRIYSHLDSDDDHRLSMAEWTNGVQTYAPLQILLGLDLKSFDDGRHVWHAKYHKRTTYCNYCRTATTSLARKSILVCTVCHYCCHPKCMLLVQTPCASTYSLGVPKKPLLHHWQEGVSVGDCSSCERPIRASTQDWVMKCCTCLAMVHSKCSEKYPSECDGGFVKGLTLLPSEVVKLPSTVEPDGSESTPMDGPKFQLVVPESNTPLAVFINPRSGGRMGKKIMRKLSYLLNPRQVFDLSDGGPLHGLTLFSQLPHFRILCCGGDGTIGWVLSVLDSIADTLKSQPPIAILPLGTGNDLARCIGWGAGHDGSQLVRLLETIKENRVVFLDRWQVRILGPENTCLEKPPSYIINNYFSIGVDAAVAYKFHSQREKHPEKFNSRLINKMRYFEASTMQQLSTQFRNLTTSLEIFMDGKKLDLSSYPLLECIALVNIPSMYGGANLWGDVKKDSHFEEQDMSDGRLEVLGLESLLHAGQVIAGVRSHAVRLAQASNIRITTWKPLPMQIDGEPWNQAPTDIHISLKNRAPMLCGSNIPKKLLGKITH